MNTIVFFLEEPSAREMLKGILPRLLPNDIDTRYLIFEGKQDLEKNLTRKLRGWHTPNSIFVVMRDQDAGDCNMIKADLLDRCQASGKTEVIVRIACRELESFYLGDLAAVEKGLGIRGLSKKQGRSKYRNPDTLHNPSNELFKLTNNTYSKVLGSRAIAPYLSLDSNTNKSYSFNMLVFSIKKLAKNLNLE